MGRCLLAVGGLMVHGMRTMDAREWKSVGAVLAALLGAACAHPEPVRPLARRAPPVAEASVAHEAVAAVPVEPERPLFAQVREEQGRAWKHEWNLVIADALEEVGQPLLEDDKVPESDVRALCPGYFDASREQKKAFWALLFASIARLESGFDPERTFMEPRPLRTLSVGLLQLSYGDQTRHSGCALEPMEANITDPSVNLRCGVAILRNQLSARNTLFPPRFYYWSVLTRKRSQIERDFQQHRAQLAFCR
ncbi:MAG TPA: transglycosylase SLT domain-containing protein [Myxococcaceae bacterium]|nr:transglycosylase SLT domain-containing protein [Myxococcaceae bacterium]